MKARWRREFTSDEPPSPPMAIWGTLYSDGAHVGKGVTIQAVLGGYARGETVTDADGKFGYSPTFKFPSEGLHSSEMGGVFKFYANQVECAEALAVEVGKVQQMDLHASGVPDTEPGAVTEQLLSFLVDIRLKASEAINLVSELEVEPQPVPFTVAGKRGRYSINYLSEFITPRARAVEDIAATVTDKVGDELLIAAFNTIAPYPYIWDDRIFGYDRWNMPHETLNMQAGDCEDTSFLLTSILIGAGIARESVRCVLGSITLEGIEYGHAWAEVLRDGEWYLLETTSDEWLGWIALPPEYTREIGFTDRTWEVFSETAQEIKAKRPKADPEKIKGLIKRQRGAISKR